MELVLATSRSESGRKLEDLYPFLRGLPLGGLVISQPDSTQIASQCELVFLAVPGGVAMQTGAELIALGLKVVDLSADFRLNDPQVYQAWYKQEHLAQDLLPQAVYGLPELMAAQLAFAKLVANPGCYPTATILALYPALKHKLIDPDDLVIDAKSGASGAGRAVNLPMLFCEVQDSFRPYNLGKHRHTPEIEQELGKIAGQNLTVSFNPHLLPINRGILATIYCKLRGEFSPELIQAIYAEEYAGCPWLRILPQGSLPETRHVRGTMFCDLGLTVDSRTRRLIITSAIDNLCRGASGQAVANANLMSGLPMDAGLNLIAAVP